MLDLVLTPLLLAFAVFIGLVAYRWRGGDRRGWTPELGRGLKLAVVGALVTSPVLLAVALEPSPMGMDVALVAAMLAIATYATSLGHGAYQDVAHTQPEKAHDRVGLYQEEPDHPLLRVLFPAGTVGGSRAAYEVVALSYTGLLIVAAPTLALLALGHPLAALALLLGGLAKGPAYWAAWRLQPRWPRLLGHDPVAVAENATGALLGLAVGTAAVLVMG